MTIDKRKSTQSFKSTDHFGGELKYFSDCILNDKQPEASGEEGLLDVRVLEAIEQSLKSGEMQRLAPYHRRRRPVPEQVEELSKVKARDLVGAEEA